jgi:hypothetical protein
LLERTATMSPRRLGGSLAYVRSLELTGHISNGLLLRSLTHIRHSTWLRSGPSSRALLVCAQRSGKSERPKFVTAVTA